MGAFVTRNLLQLNFILLEFWFYFIISSRWVTSYTGPNDLSTHFPQDINIMNQIEVLDLWYQRVCTVTFSTQNLNLALRMTD